MESDVWLLCVIGAYARVRVCVCTHVHACVRVCMGAGSPAWETPGQRKSWVGVVVAIVYFLRKHTVHPHPAPALLRACGEVNSNGLNSEEKAGSTIGRKIKIIKTNSNCSQRNQFHNFSASLNLLLRPCCAGHGACTGACGVQTQERACGFMLVCACLHRHICVLCVRGGTSKLRVHGTPAHVLTFNPGWKGQESRVAGWAQASFPTQRPLSCLLQRPPG